ncbi:uncharacterized protein BDZ99DRAFT_49546 [Mytilinidion resinicola]|uniref:Uncharacterized protein n=1 Tax=Mytilinidion resinicola TaxID=574789 RepID=A0A6A6YJT3_9PEZI|nr:uncharacterized protein BDZ99DRAFT_49546 [Mytilinidion resinicola]KAF2808224.1 hypothetical protein BDZ99DRAFT_49546 [Mytilinidion resinicola]
MAWCGAFERCMSICCKICVGKCRNIHMLTWQKSAYTFLWCFNVLTECCIMISWPFASC